MRAEIQNMKQELSTISMMDEFARYARLERKINKMTDKLKTHGRVQCLLPFLVFEKHFSKNGFSFKHISPSTFLSPSYRFSSVPFLLSSSSQLTFVFRLCIVLHMLIRYIKFFLQ